MGGLPTDVKAVFRRVLEKLVTKVHRSHVFWRANCSIFRIEDIPSGYPEDVGIVHLRTAHVYVPIYTASYPRRLELSSASP